MYAHTHAPARTSCAHTRPPARARIARALRRRIVRLISRFFPRMLIHHRTPSTIALKLIKTADNSVYCRKEYQHSITYKKPFKSLLNRSSKNQARTDSQQAPAATQPPGAPLQQAINTRHTTAHQRAITARTVSRRKKSQREAGPY